MPSAVLALDTGVMVAGAAVRSARLDPSRFEASPKRRLAEREIRLGARSWQVADLIGEVLDHVKQKAMWVPGGSQPSRLVLTYPQRWDQARKELLASAVQRTGIERRCRPAGQRADRGGHLVRVHPTGAGRPVRRGVRLRRRDARRGDPASQRRPSRPPSPCSRPMGSTPSAASCSTSGCSTGRREQLTAGGNGALISSLDQPENLGALLTLKEQIRHAKHELAEYNSALIPVAVGPLSTVLTITVDEFDALVGPTSRPASS